MFASVALLKRLSIGVRLYVCHAIDELLHLSV